MSAGLFEVRTFTAGGVQDKIVKGARPQFTSILNGVGHVGFTVPRVNAEGVLGHSVEVGLFYEGVEIRNSRAILAETEGNSVGTFDGPGTAGEATWAGKSLLGRLEKAIVYPSNWPTTPPAEGHEFIAANGGTVLKTLINLAQARGSLANITHSSWSTTLDSNGAAWVGTVNFTAPTGSSLMSVLEMLVRAGLVDVEMVGRDLRLYKGDTLGTDYGIGHANPIVIRRGKQATDLPYSESSADMINAYLLIGDEGVMYERTDSASIAQYGRLEGSMSQSGVSDEGTLYVFGDIALEKTATPRSSYTVKVEQEQAGPNPLIDYKPGDWILLDRAGTLEHYRIRQLSVATEGDLRHTVVATLNDIFVERDLINERRLEAITGATSGSPGGVVTPPPDEEVIDTLSPKAPTGLGGTTSAYLNAFGMPRAQISLTWVDPTQNTDNTALEDLAEIRVYTRTDSALDPWVLVNTVDAGDEVAYAPDFDPNVYRRFTVIAVDNENNWSPQATELRILMAADATPPATPATPTATVRLSVATIGWNGLTSGGGAMPADFARIDIHVSTTTGFTPSSADLVGTMGKLGTFAWAVPTYNTAHYVKFIAYDTSGNASAASAQTSFTATPLVSGDLTTGVAGNKTTVAGTAPGSPTTGDMWIDTGNGNVIKIWDGSSWVNRQDAAIATAQAAATTAQSTANGKNKVYYSTGTPGSTANVAGDIWFQYSGGVIIGQWIGAGGTSWTSTTLGNLVIAALDAGKITTGFLSAARIAAHSITTPQLIIGDDKNLVVNGTGEWGSKGGWLDIASSTFETTDKPSEVAGVVKTAAGQGSQTGASIATHGWDVTPGEEFYIEVWVKADVPDSRFYIEFRDQNVAHAMTHVAVPGENWAGTASFPVANLVVPTTWTKYASIGTVTATATRCRVGVVYFNHSNGTERNAVQSVAVRVRRRNTGKLIVDGTIVASHLAAGSVVAGKIAADAVTTDTLAANAITTDKVAAGSITAEKMSFGVLRNNLVADPSFEETYAFSNYDPFGFGPGGVWTYGDYTKWRWDYGATTSNPNTSLTRSVGVGRSRSGRSGVSIYTQATQEASILSPSTEVEVGKTYRLTIYAAALTNTVQMVTQMFTSDGPSITPFSTGVTLVGDRSTWSNIAPVAEPLSATSFTQLSWVFTATNTWIMMRIISWPLSGDRTLVLDDISIVEVGVGGSSELTAAGLRLFDEEGYESTALVSNRPHVLSVMEKGVVIASIDDEGEASFKNMASREDILVNGRPLIGLAEGELFPGSTSPYQGSLIESLPLGMVQWGKLTAVGPQVTTTEKGYIEIAAPIYHNRMYKLCTNSLRIRTTADSPTTAAEVNVYYTTGTAGNPSNWPSTPLVASSAKICRITPLFIPDDIGAPMTLQFLWRPDPGSVMNHAFAYNARFLLSLKRTAGSGTLYLDADTSDFVEFWIEDIGPARNNGGQANPGDGTVTAVPLRTTTKVYTSTSYKSYKGDGTERTGADVTGPRQGYTSSNGDQKGLWIFPSMTGDLSGATITRVRAYVMNENFSMSTGSTKIGVHNYSSAPASSPTLVTNATHNGWVRGTGKWVDLIDTGGLFAGLIAGTVKGLSVGPAGTEDRLYTGKFAAVAKIEIQFTK